MHFPTNTILFYSEIRKKCLTNRLILIGGLRERNTRTLYRQSVESNTFAHHKKLTKSFKLSNMGESAVKSNVKGLKHLENAVLIICFLNQKPLHQIPHNQNVNWRSTNQQLRIFLSVLLTKVKKWQKSDGYWKLS